MAFISESNITLTGGYEMPNNSNPGVELQKRVEEHKQWVADNEAGGWKLIGVSFDFLTAVNPPTLVVATVWERTR